MKNVKTSNKSIVNLSPVQAFDQPEMFEVKLSEPKTLFKALPRESYRTLLC